MITLATGNVLEADAEALVNTVNCVGFMGKGIALQFKKAYPDNCRAYEAACRAREVQPGRMFVYPTGLMVNPKFIINFPTKRHWREGSRLEDIESGLTALITELRSRKVASVAVPPLGCGLGGLDWSVVRPLIERAFERVPEVRLLLYEPQGAPPAKEQPIGTKRPHLTVARACLIQLMQQYTRLAYRLTLLEIQKLAYFLQAVGEPLRLRYEAGKYGPYAHNLNKVLEVLEGHFTRGYGDTQRPDVDIDLLPNASPEAARFLAGHPESLPRLARVFDLIAGFETPYGMELLASAHWVAHHSSPPCVVADDAIAAIHAWSDRKRTMFRPDHIRVAWTRLGETHWLPEAVR